MRWLRLPYYFHYKAWLCNKHGKLRGGAWAFIRKHEKML